EIEDDGPGIAEGMRPHLFDPFVTSKRTGTGLGLALVAKIIGDHGGIIECESEPPRTIFRVLLPLGDRRGRATGKSAVAQGNVSGAAAATDTGNHSTPTKARERG
ncbi:MAG: hypothetical protein JSS20_21740, partial [Proteobacteria bacterium]|nr:hypothetical protein [Pseudomonadota bacterium]